MESGKPSRTAWAAAAHRAAHQVIEKGRIFADPLALRILGSDADEIVRKAAENPSSRRMRAFIAVRSRFAEEAILAAAYEGVTQLVILGAGLDTFAYRNSLRDGLRIFEVDYPATQAWKRERLRETGIEIPPSLTFAPVDFERQTLADGLIAAGFDPTQPTFFTWLGVVPYLTHNAIWSTLTYIASLPVTTHVVFDYGNPHASLTPDLRAELEQSAQRVAKLGEAWLTYFDTDELHEKLKQLGYSTIEDLGPSQIVERYFPGRAVKTNRQGGHILHAINRKAAHL